MATVDGVDTVIAESITLCGGCIVVTQHKTTGGKLGCGLTHKPTGMTLTGNTLSNDITALKRKARAAWRQLTPGQRKAWQSDDIDAIRDNTPVEVARGLRG